MNEEVVSWVAKIMRQACRQPFQPILRPFAAEVLGARLMRLLGVGAPEEIRQEPLPEVVDRENWIVKSLDFGRLRARDVSKPLNTLQLCVLVRRIHGAISLSVLRARYGVTAPLPSPGPATSLMDMISIKLYRAGLVTAETLSADRNLYSDRALVRGLVMMVKTGKYSGESCDFEPPADWTAVRRAIAWGSEQMLLIHAARAFLGCSTAHAGNILVDAEGKLYSVDHEYCSVTDGFELELLSRYVKPGTRSAGALKRIAEIEEGEIRGLFEDLPAEVSWPLDWPLGDRATTVEHFITRLHRWRGLRSRGAAVTATISA